MTKGRIQKILLGCNLENLHLKAGKGALWSLSPKPELEKHSPKNVVAWELGQL